MVSLSYIEVYFNLDSAFMVFDQFLDKNELGRAMAVNKTDFLCTFKILFGTGLNKE